MPLHELVDYFNQRLADEHGLDLPPLSFCHGYVEGRFGDLRFSSDFRSVRSGTQPGVVVGHDARLIVSAPESKSVDSSRIFFGAETADLINLDRFCRTIHMLNYLPVSHEDGLLFLEVHPRHVLGVERNHGAYFEDIIFRCGLSPQRVVISVPVSPVYGAQLLPLLQGLHNYGQRGYRTAVCFDDKADDAFLERYCIEFLFRMTPDIVRLDGRFFRALTAADPETQIYRRSLLTVIHKQGVQLLIDGVRSDADLRYALDAQADFLAGEIFEPAQRQSSIA